MVRDALRKLGDAPAPGAAAPAQPGGSPGNQPLSQSPPGQSPPGQSPPGQSPPGQSPPGQSPPGQSPGSQSSAPAAGPLRPAAGQPHSYDARPAETEAGTAPL
ncbi:MAG: hypothetical protein ACLP7J_14380, partial [Streptosporangiaceae bacterium]